MLPLRCSIARKEFVKGVRCSIDLNNVTGTQLTASSGFRFTIHFHLTTLDQQLRPSACISNAMELQELIEP